MAHTSMFTESVIKTNQCPGHKSSKFAYQRQLIVSVEKGIQTASGCKSPICYEPNNS